ncbi:Phosphoribosylformimino-5-aminoimidazole carboxamide ribotide isomerase [Metschnikowia bicuspidata var. bicuspidata NRRL YB-4993]|uniref:1-(5-phosphoribosyl)-5-[(5-phosphoribosylamino)methylideneamino] imidazole-4-carboxamide isomerase n=1 Tax=Metschnikowia bicuspidata var. bicuspidata NRRL YB-4993 TaxID=869754 RepID=A0A1A0HJJ4_9ASCO|nr:Phosphoribosylformimino-5-aminoimidazole carboxamide ribotide isomerase [Metschnikowia bicuspidata var. bicuspidata NRRL YB-4993]OBA24008.1 Phosphoribosylformimino-5-aminoimidazole carboxamide ribotide isomerase [Metschnikowia bicuspidata var. bicuspidata NRRL YB-4993]
MTRFRGCIDIHAGQVKQIVGGSLTADDTHHSADTKENFVSTKPSSHYARLYQARGVEGCHVIKLGSNPANDEAARLACATWPGHLQVGGGITDDNALTWLDTYHASHVIVTSWLFSKTAAGQTVLDWQKLARLSERVGKTRLIVDLSCREVAGAQQKKWVVSINKWQTLTDSELGPDFLAAVADYCDEFLIHAADVEGLCKGIDEDLVASLGRWCPPGFAGKIVYAGGAKLVSDLALVDRLSAGKVDLTFGSALDIFGGDLVKFEDVVRWGRT